MWAIIITVEYVRTFSAFDIDNFIEQLSLPFRTKILFDLLDSNIEIRVDLINNYIASITEYLARVP
jgi:hypothetical protein